MLRMTQLCPRHPLPGLHGGGAQGAGELPTEGPASCIYEQVHPGPGGLRLWVTIPDGGEQYGNSERFLSARR